jgi:arginine utilization protein RocB
MHDRTAVAFLITLLILTGCSRSTVRKPTTAEDLRIAREAIPLSEVSLMMRGGYKQDSIVAEVIRRHIPSAPDAQTEDSLLQAGATSKLLAALKDKKNVLTENQKEAYDNMTAEKAGRAEESDRMRRDLERAQVIAENRDRQRRQNLSQQTIQNAYASENRVIAYDQADRAYKARKESLEASIISQENYINRARSRGCTEAYLRNANATLDRYKEDLRNLTPPLR